MRIPQRVISRFGGSRILSELFELEAATDRTRQLFIIFADVMDSVPLAVLGILILRDAIARPQNATAHGVSLLLIAKSCLAGSTFSFLPHPKNPAHTQCGSGLNGLF